MSYELDTPISEIDTPLFQPSKTYKPFKHEWAEMWRDRQQSVHWMARELPMGEDLKNWSPQSEQLTNAERALLTNIFRLFTQADVDVLDNYMNILTKVFRNGEVSRMLSVFSSFETIHIEAYSYVLESLKLPDSTYHEFMDIEEMREKHDYLKRYNADTLKDLLMTVGCFAAFVEGLQLFASFAMLLNFPRFGLMRNMGQIVSWSIRDETIHVNAGLKLFHTLREETGIKMADLAEDFYEAARNYVRMEDAFIDRAFEFGETRGSGPEDYKKYVRYIADMRLGQLGLDPIYNIEEHPLPWIDEVLGQEHANFFEVRATEYSKGAATGSWDRAWEVLDDAEKDPLDEMPAEKIHERRIRAGLAEALI